MRNSKGQFIKGNKHTPETVIKIIGGNVGKVPWNLGLKGFRSGKGTRPNSIPKGELHWNYKKDRTELAKANEHRNDIAHHEWSKNIKNRDNWKCRINNSACKGRLEAHHILSWRDCPELRYEINNGITLCHAHHPRSREKEAELSPFFQKLVAEKN